MGGRRRLRDPSGSGEPSCQIIREPSPRPSYDFPTRELQPIAGMIAFYNEQVDVFIDGAAVERPITRFFPVAETGDAAG